MHSKYCGFFVVGSNILSISISLLKVKTVKFCNVESEGSQKSLGFSYNSVNFIEFKMKAVL